MSSDAKDKMSASALARAGMIALAYAFSIGFAYFEAEAIRDCPVAGGLQFIFIYLRVEVPIVFFGWLVLWLLLSVLLFVLRVSGCGLLARRILGSKWTLAAGALLGLVVFAAHYQMTPSPIIRCYY
jgi:hypothetical protein